MRSAKFATEKYLAVKLLPYSSQKQQRTTKTKHRQVT